MEESVLQKCYAFCPLQACKDTNPSVQTRKEALRGQGNLQDRMNRLLMAEQGQDQGLAFGTSEGCGCYGNKVGKLRQGMGSGVPTELSWYPFPSLSQHS